LYNSKSEQGFKFAFGFEVKEKTMAEKSGYKTKHKQEMLEYLEATKGNHFTAAEIIKYFKETGNPIGKTTVYRQLEELIASGDVKKYVIDENSGACFEFIGGECKHHDCYHMKCEKCGKLFHLECHEIEELKKHIEEHHGFHLNMIRTVFYGLCDECDGKCKKKRNVAGNIYISK